MTGRATLPRVQDRRPEIGLCVLLAASDGDVSEAEIRELSTRLGALLGEDVSALAIGVAVDEEIGRMQTLGVERYVEELAKRMSGRDPLPALKAALAIAIADGLAPEEESMFREVSTALGVPPDRAATLLSHALAPPPSGRLA
jgi:tellurite resistance protein